MFKTLTATILSATLAFGAIAPSQARAGDGGDLARLLFGVATLAIIANELNAGSSSSQSTQRRDNVISGQIVRPKSSNVVTRHNARTVPRSCQRVVETRDGTRRLFGVPCLRREGVRVAQLPKTCRRTLNLPNRTVDAYSQRCLWNNGVRIVN